MNKLSIIFLLCIALNGYSAIVDSSRPSTPDGEVAGHGYVDLGLPSGTLWATSNIDAESPYDPGTYFAWGETKGRDYFRWLDYELLEEWHTDTNIGYTYTATDIGEAISGTTYDAARAQWGDSWRLPTEEDWMELNEYCSMEYKEYSYIPVKKGMLICGPNGNRIFLSITYSPRYYDLGPVRTAEYWTATAANTLAEDKYPAAVMMTFGKNNSKLTFRPDGRHEGFAIRPVISRQDIGTSVATIDNDATSMTYENGTLTVNGHVPGYRLTIADLSGRRVIDSPVNDGKCRLTDLPKGIYLAALHNAGRNVKTLKISVK